MAGINYYHKLPGYSDITNIFIIQKLLEGCSRCRGVKDNRRPITKLVLLAVLEALPKVCYNVYETKLFNAIFTLAYFGLFRVSELVATSVISSNRQIQVQDIVISANLSSVSVRLTRFKTNQKGPPVTLKILDESNSSVCPVHALQNYLRLRGTYSGPLFCHGTGVPVTRHQFSAVLVKCMQHTSFDYNSYKSHSFRIGRATDLATSGLPASVIMKMGRWSSDAYKGYIR